LKSKLLKLPKNRVEIIEENPEEMEKEKRESQEKINKRRREKKLKVRPLNNNKFLLNKLNSIKLLLPREKEEEEEAERVNSDLFNSIT